MSSIKSSMLSFPLLVSMLMCSLISRAESTTEFIKPVVYLLDFHRSQYRLDKIASEFTEAEIKYTSVRGIEGKSVNVSEYIQGGILDTRWLPTPTLHPLYHNERTVGSKKLHEIPLSAEKAALSLSHKNILQGARDQLLDVMIFEDDVVIPPGANFWRKYEDIYAELPDDWDIFYLGAWDQRCLKEAEAPLGLFTLNYSQEDENTDCHPGTYAWVVRNQSIGKVLDILQVFHEEIDHQLLRNFGSELKAYWVSPALAEHDFSVTAQNSLADFAPTSLQPSKTVEKCPESAVLPVKYEQLHFSINVENCEIAGHEDLVTKLYFLRCLSEEEKRAKIRSSEPLRNRLRKSLKVQ